MDRIAENAKIVVEIARLSPEDSLSSIISVLDMPIIDRNNALWFAAEQGFIDDPGSDLSKPVSLNYFEPLHLKEVADAQRTILYCMNKLAEKQSDISEGTVTEWLRGYKAHIIVIALKQLLESKEIYSYTLMDAAPVGKKGKSIMDTPYIFYCLPENMGKNWGIKQFKDATRVRLQEVDDIETTATKH